MEVQNKSPATNQAITWLTCAICAWVLGDCVSGSGDSVIHSGEMHLLQNLQGLFQCCDCLITTLVPPTKEKLCEGFCRKYGIQTILLDGVAR